jgi:hypothetical protein
VSGPSTIRESQATKLPEGVENVDARGSEFTSVSGNQTIVINHNPLTISDRSTIREPQATKLPKGVENVDARGSKFTSVSGNQTVVVNYNLLIISDRSIVLAAMCYFGFK